MISLVHPITRPVTYNRWTSRFVEYLLQITKYAFFLISWKETVISAWFVGTVYILFLWFSVHRCSQMYYWIFLLSLLVKFLCVFRYPILVQVHFSLFYCSFVQFVIGLLFNYIFVFLVSSLAYRDLYLLPLLYSRSQVLVLKAKVRCLRKS